MQHFEMYENISTKTGDHAARDLTIRKLNQVVTEDTFSLNNGEYANKYKTWRDHDMHGLIRKARRIAWRLLRLRLGFVKKIDTISDQARN